MTDIRMWDEILKRAARQGARSGTLPEPTAAFLEKVWPALVGDQIARLSAPVELTDETLHIRVRDQALVEQWRRSPQLLLRRLRSVCPWTVEKLGVEYDPNASVISTSQGRDTSRTTQSDNRTDQNQTEADEGRQSEFPAVTKPQGLDDETSALIDAIDAHLHKRNNR